jgi:DNA polymerase-3 subunit delta'
MSQNQERPSVAAGTDDILGQQRACEQLWSAVRSDRLHHCYLFEGRAGVGKATVALRLAMAANCEGPRDGPLPCAACGPCRSIADGQHPDVIELRPDLQKASGSIGVEQVREVLRRLSLHRHSARCRFVIVDPADKMRAEATNALLKTLEEPPLGTGFVLVTSRAASLLPTVISRSLRVRFGSVPVDELAAWLAARGLAEPERLARLALGSPGQAILLGEGRLGALADARAALVGALEGGPKGLFDYCEKLCASPRSSWEPRVELCLDALELLLRDAVCFAAGAPERALDPAQAELAQDWAVRLWPGGVRKLERGLEDARQRLAVNVAPRLVMEALLSALVVELGKPPRRADP